MATPAVPAALESGAQYPGEFDRLRRFIQAHLGRFTLGLVRVNDPRQRDHVIASLAQALAADGAQLLQVDLGNRRPASLREAIGPALESARPGRAALALTGAEHLMEAEAGPAGRPPFAAALNLEREALRAETPLPLILFLTDHAMDRLDIASPDFFDWYSGLFTLRPASVSAPPMGTTVPMEIPIRAAPAPANDLSEQTRAERLELLEARRVEMEQAGPEARPRLAEVLKEIGELYAALPEYDDRQLAISYLKQAGEIFHEKQASADEAAVLEMLGEVCYWINDYAQATRRCEAALRLYQELGDRLGEANCIQRLGDVHTALSELPQARQRYEQALPLYREIGDRLGEANAYTSFGDLGLAEKNYAAARAWFEQALGIYVEIGGRIGQTYVAPRLARALLALGEKEKAILALEKGAEVARAVEGQPNLNAIQSMLDEVRTGPRSFWQRLRRAIKRLVGRHT